MNQLEKSCEPLIQFGLEVSGSILHTFPTKDCPDCSPEEQSLVTTEIQSHLDPHEILSGDFPFNFGVSKGDGLNPHGAILPNSLVLRKVVQEFGSNSLLTGRRHSFNDLHGIVLQRHDITHVSHTFLPLTLAMLTLLTDALDLLTTCGGPRGSGTSHRSISTLRQF